MRRTTKTLVLFLLLTGALLAQAASHSVTLTWTDTANPAGTTYSVYRAVGLCSGSPTFAKLASAIAVKTYQDTSVTPGNYCYAVTATASGMESPQSNSALAPVPSFAPQALTVTVQ
jgi:hypothetical protein